MKSAILSLLLAIAPVAHAKVEYHSLVHAQNMERLGCALPDATNRFVSSTAPHQLFFADEPVTITLAFGAVTPGEYHLEIREIVQRQIEAGNPAITGVDDSARPSWCRSWDLLLKLLIFIAVLFVFRILARVTRRMVRAAINRSGIALSNLIKNMSVSISGGSVMVIGILIALSFIGISLIIDDGVITPAISILSAVEGLLLIPGLEETKQAILISIAGLIAIALFSVQKKGTEKVAAAFGPIMIIWFSALSLSGLGSIIHVPSVIKAVNPYYAVNFLVEHGIAGFFVLSEVILCATGGEALYADMGHLGRAPIVRAWYFVFFSLIINYLGQGAFVITHPDAKNVLFEMVFNQARPLYMPIFGV